MGRQPTVSDFKFKDPANTSVFVCGHVADGEPILIVSHDGGGDWQFLCGRPHGESADDKPVLLCLEHVVERDASLNALAEMCTNHHAERASTEDEWVITDDSEAFIEQCVAEIGWSVEAIEAGRGEDEPPFAYTVGLHKSFSHPELIVVGLPPDVAIGVLNGCGERVKEGLPLPVAERIGGILEGYDVTFRPVRDEERYREHVGYAIWFNKGTAFPLLQLLWPDKDGRFPGDPGAATFMAKRQPLLR